MTTKNRPNTYESFANGPLQTVPEESPDAKSRRGCCKIVCCGSDSCMSVLRQSVVELIGLAIFVYIGGLSMRGSGHNKIIQIAAGHGLTLSIMIMAIGHISGGHLNPAVTLSFVIQSKISWFTAISYWIAQIIGAIIGGIMLLMTVQFNNYREMAGGSIPVDISDSNAGTEFQAFITEVILTFILIYVILMTAVDRDDNALAPIAIGLAVFVGIIAGGDISGGSMNPARSFGPLVVYTFFGPYSCPSPMTGTTSGNMATGGSFFSSPATSHNISMENCITVLYVWRTHYIHWLGPLSGAAIASFLYRMLMSSNRGESN